MACTSINPSYFLYGGGRDREIERMIIIVVFMIVLIAASIMARKTIGGGWDDDEILRTSCMYGSDRYPIFINLASRTWVTPIKTATLIKRIIDDLIPDGMVRLLDMTANCGGNLLPFIDDERYSGKAYEIDPAIYDILVGNIKRFPRKGDWYVECASSTKDMGIYDVIVVDPPFGDEYKTGVLYQPRLGDLDMTGLVKEFAGRCKFIVLKLPMIGFDVDGFVDGVGSRDCMTVYKREDLDAMDGRTHKITLIVIDTSAITA